MTNTGICPTDTFKKVRGTTQTQTRVVLRKPLPSFTSFMGSAKSHLLNFSFLIWKTNITKWDKVPNVLYTAEQIYSIVIIRIISGCIYYVRRLLGTSYFYIIQSSKSFEEDTLLFPFPRWRNRGIEAVQQLVQQTQLEEQVAGCEPGLSASRAQVLLSVWTLHISLIHILASEPTSTLTFWCNTELTRRIISWHHIDIYSCFEHSSVTKWHS